MRLQQVLELLTRPKQLYNADLDSGKSVQFQESRGRVYTMLPEGNPVLVICGTGGRASLWKPWPSR